MANKAKIKTWLKAHKAELAATGIGIVVLAGFVVAYKKTDGFSALLAKLNDLLSRLFDNSTDTDDFMKVLPTEIRDTTAVQAPDIVSFPEITKAPHDVQMHLRNLHPGWHASQEKIKDALEMGIALLDGQTWVRDYRTGIAA